MFIGTELIPILRLILETLILFSNGWYYINNNEIILLYEKSVDINKWLRFCGDWFIQCCYDFVCGIKNLFLVAVIKWRLIGS